MIVLLYIMVSPFLKQGSANETGSGIIELSGFQAKLVSGEMHHALVTFMRDGKGR